jgi:CheY-like chemotaxis protein/Tfp pilus assembly protein PilZ
MPDNKLTVLAVDDEADLLEILAMRFESKGFKVLTASNGVDALKIIKTEKVEIVVSDINMPGGNGIELLDNVKKFDPTIPFILFVSGFENIILAEAFDKGAEAVFSKPFDTNILLEAVLKVTANNQEGKRLGQTHRENTMLKMHLKFSDHSQYHSVEIKNLGRGGFFMALPGVLPQQDSEVTFEFQIQGSDSKVKGQGKVRWIRTSNRTDSPRGCGVEFVSFEANGKAKIFEFINYLKTKQYIPKA